MNGARQHTPKLTLEYFRIPGRSAPNGLEEAEEKLYNSFLHPWQKCEIQMGLPSGRTESNIVRGEFIRFLALEGDGRCFVHEKGLHLDGAYIEGELDFHGCEIKRPLFLTNCRFSGALILEDARTCTIRLDGSAIPHIGAQRARIAGGLFLHNCKVHGQVRLIGTDIGGSLECHGASISCAASGWVPAGDRHIALYASRAKIAGSVFLQHGCHVAGETSFRGSTIRGNLTCRSGKFDNPEGKALDCDGADIGGNVAMDRDFSAHGCVWFNGATVHGKILCDGGKFNAGNGHGAKALSAKRARIEGSVYLRKYTDKGNPDKDSDFLAAGEVNFVDSRIGGSLECHGGHFLNRGGKALYCSRATVSGSVFLHEGFTAEGEVVFRSASIGSNFTASNSHLNADAQPGLKDCGNKSLSCERIQIGGSLYLQKADVKYQVCLLDANIGGSLECQGAEIENPYGISLYASRAKIAGSVFLVDQFQARGTVAFAWAGIGANLKCDTGSFDGFSSYKEGRAVSRAIDCEGAKIAGSVFMGDGFFACGEVQIVNAEIGGSLGCAGGFFNNKRPRGAIQQRTNTKQGGKKARPGDGEKMCADALKLRGTTIKGSLWLGPSHTPPHDRDVVIFGALDLRDVRAGVFIDSESSWPPENIEFEGKKLACPIFLDGFEYGRIGSPASLDVNLRERWLDRQPAADLKTDFKSQAFEQLVRVLRGMGQLSSAHKIAIVKERRYHRRPLQHRPWRGWPWWLSPERWLRLIVFDWFAGYGYRSHRIVIVAMLVWLACGATYWAAYDKGLLHPSYVGTTKDYVLACKAALEQGDKEQYRKLECPDFGGLRALKYSADLILPIIQLGEKPAWKFKPEEDGTLAYLADVLTHLENLFGWVAGMILAALLGHKINKE